METYLYQTSDGQRFDSEGAAKNHQDYLDGKTSLDMSNSTDRAKYNSIWTQSQKKESSLEDLSRLANSLREDRIYERNQIIKKVLLIAIPIIAVIGIVIKIFVL